MTVQQPIVIHVDTFGGWLLPFVSGVAAALIGAAVGIVGAAWLEARKRKRERRELDAALVILMQEEVATNIAFLDTNNLILTSELQTIAQGVSERDALCELGVDAWNAVVMDLPRWLPDHTPVLSRSRALRASCAQLNALTRERTQLKVQGPAADTWSQRMRQIDETILQKNALVRQTLVTQQTDLTRLVATLDEQMKRRITSPRSWRRG